jgi:signal transduction histidine kinase
MTSTTSTPRLFTPAGENQRPDVERLLEAWNTATARLQETHQTLREQVRRLSDELEIKNRELARKNRLADLGQLASHVAHEVRNGLMPLTLYASLLRRRLSADAGSQSVLDKIETGLTALDTIVNDLLHFTVDRVPQKTQFDSYELVREVCQALQPQLDAQRIVTELDVPLGLGLLADRDMVRRALLNLVLNALDVMPDGGELIVTGVRTPQGIEIEVADSGPGVSDEVLKRAFEPFYTTKSGGTGLGLAIVYRTLQMHGGEVTAANCPQGGAAFTLKFPRRALEAAA